jgi:transglutaminase/protease-like cytokinesis protein 3
MYYGADIGQFPPHIRDWIVNKGFSKSKMEVPSALNPQLNVRWSDDGNAILAEASYTIASGYLGAGSIKTWGSGTYPFRDSNVKVYGQYDKYRTLKYQYDLKREVEYLMANDPAYAEVINFAKQLCREIEYDWSAFSDYHGARPIRTPGMKYAVCDGYSNEVMEKALSLKCVKSIEKWTGPNHAWNVINLVDGRTLYFDLTWFDNEHIKEDTGQIYQTDDYDWENITFNEDLFRHSNVGYGSGTFSHDKGKFDRSGSRSL